MDLTEFLQESEYKRLAVLFYHHTDDPQFDLAVKKYLLEKTGISPKFLHVAVVLWGSDLLEDLMIELSCTGKMYTFKSREIRSLVEMSDRVYYFDIQVNMHNVLSALSVCNHLDVNGMKAAIDRGHLDSIKELTCVHLASSLLRVEPFGSMLLSDDLEKVILTHPDLLSQSKVQDEHNALLYSAHSFGLE